MILSIFKTLYNHHRSLIPEHFHHPKKKPCVINSYSPTPSSCSPLRSLNYFHFVQICLFDISNKWNHTICCIFTQHNVFKVHPCCSTYQYYTFFFNYSPFLQIIYLRSPISKINKELFFMYTFMRNAGLEEAQAGIKIAGRNINNLRYAPLRQKVKN